MTDVRLTWFFAADGQGPGGLPLSGTGGVNPPGPDNVGTFGTRAGADETEGSARTDTGLFGATSDTAVEGGPAPGRSAGGPVTDGPPRDDEILGDQVAGGDVVGGLHSPEEGGPGSSGIGGVAGIGATGVGAAPGSDSYEDTEDEVPISKSGR